MGRDFKKFQIWNMAYSLVLKSYKILENFPDYENKNITDQIRRAVTSLPLNIAEGAGSPSNREFLQFLGFSYRSAKELEVLFMLSKDLKYINDKTYLDISKELEEFKGRMYRFMESVDKEIKEGKRNYSFNWKRKK